MVRSLAMYPPQPPIVVDRYPEDGALRGFFSLGDESGHVTSVHRGAWKNVDYLRLRDAALHLINPRPGMTILDIGCGRGSMMVYCGLQGATVYGVDLDATAVRATNDALRRLGISGEARVADATKRLFDASVFDAAISSDFFEHIGEDDKRAVLREAYRVLKAGAPLVVKTPNLSYLRLSLWYKRGRALTRFRNPFRIVIAHTPGTDDPQHIGLTNRQQFSDRLLESGFVNYHFVYPPLRRFPSRRHLLELLSTEIPVIRDWLSEDLVCLTHKPISLAHFPD